MKKVNISILLCLVAMILCACSPASKEEVLRYAENEFGKAEYVRTEEIDDKTIRYYFLDEEHGFEYCVTSEVRDILIDGAKFGETESKASNFDKVYYEYVLAQVQDELTALEETYGVTIRDGLEEEAQLGYEYRLAEVYVAEGDSLTAAQAAEVIHDVFVAYDTRNYWEDKEVAAYDTREEKLGSYSCKYNRWLTPQDETDVFYYEQIQMLNSDATFVRKEQKVFKDTNISLEDVPSILGSEPVTEDSMVTYYYFTVDGKEYYLADVLVLVEGSMVWYTNYEKE